MNPYDPAQLFAAAAANRVDPIHPDRPTLNPYVYLPTTGLLMRPLAWLRYGEAKVVWFWLNWALAGLLSFSVRVCFACLHPPWPGWRGRPSWRQRRPSTAK